MQGVASLNADPIPGWRRCGVLRECRRRDALPMLAIFGAQDGFNSANDPSQRFRRRNASQEIGGYAARLRLPGLPLIGGMFDAARQAETPERAAARRSKNYLWSRDLGLRQSFDLSRRRRAGSALEILPFRTVDFAGGRRRRRCRRCGRDAGAECLGYGFLFGCLRGWKPIVFCIVLAGVSSAAGFENLRRLWCVRKRFLLLCEFLSRDAGGLRPGSFLIAGQDVASRRRFRRRRQVCLADFVFV